VALPVLWFSRADAGCEQRTSFLRTFLSLYSLLKNKAGPLRVASEFGGQILHLEVFDKTGLSFREYVAAFEKKV
jgi:hypothetical protein